MGLSKSTRITILLGINSVFFLLELVVGYTVHSLALVADSFHMVWLLSYVLDISSLILLQLNDVISLFVGLWAVKVASAKTKSTRYTYGVSRNLVMEQSIDLWSVVATRGNPRGSHQRRFSGCSVSLHLP
jgi:zinc transporter 1